jgi:hypothetical protein
MPFIIDIHCDHLLITNIFPAFPAQLNLSHILTTYPNIKAEISDASDINVYSVAALDYVPVIVDLELSADKLLLYFSADIDNLEDKNFRITVGYESSSNDSTVFSNLYERFWGFNQTLSTAPQDICLASGAVYTKNTSIFAYDTLFYKGVRGYNGYGTCGVIPCLTYGVEFAIHLRIQKRNAGGIGTMYYMITYPHLNLIFKIIQSASNYLSINLQQAYNQNKSASVNINSWVDYSFHDVFFVVNFNMSTNSSIVKIYVDGYPVTVGFGGYWTGFSSTGNLDGSWKVSGEVSSQNYAVIDLLGIIPGPISAEYILTSANQYLNSGFWVVDDITENGNVVPPTPVAIIIGNKVNSLLIQQLKKQLGDDSEYTIPTVAEIVSEPEITELTLRKNTSGCLYAKNNNGDFPDPFVSGDELHWTKPSSRFELSISSGSLRCYYNSPYDDAFVMKNNQVEIQSKLCIYCSLESAVTAYKNFLGLGAHTEDVVHGIEDYVYFILRTNDSSYSCRIGEVVNSVNNSLDQLSPVSTPHGTYGFWLFVDDNDILAFDDFHQDELSGITNTLDSGLPGVVMYGGYAIAYLHDYFAMADRYITVIGLATGDSVELRKSNDDVIVSSSESGGVATLDIYKKAPIDFYKLVIVRDSIDIMEYVASAGDYICGGDEYELLTPRNILEEKVNSLLIQQFRKQYL